MCLIPRGHRPPRAQPAPGAGVPHAPGAGVPHAPGAGVPHDTGAGVPQGTEVPLLDHQPTPIRGLSN
jgi:hypothetical protein